MQILTEGAKKDLTVFFEISRIDGFHALKHHTGIRFQFFYSVTEHLLRVMPQNWT